MGETSTLEVCKADHTNLWSTKFILGMAGILSATGLCAFNFIHEGVYSAVVIFAMGIYSTANVAQKVI